MLRSLSNPADSVSKRLQNSLGIRYYTCMPQTAAVGLNADLDEPITLFLAHGLDTECARVCVGTNHGYRVSWLITRHQISSGITQGVFLQTRTFHLCPIANARIVVALRVRKYLPPGTHCLAHGFFS